MEVNFNRTAFRTAVLYIAFAFKLLATYILSIHPSSHGSDTPLACFISTLSVYY